ncbi:MAG: HU family DNA-binding protein [Shewanella psychromarinicola]|jgi:DNA-binding protein HU-alpha|uniref:HU family DNA-binding protein n=1 Tax=Shewanella psychromarinicola TaxID=2487742 RepID=A0A3N4DBB2_9GAMM|nr:MULTISPECIES: HU family DNA-binding protein [Shewanella]AZG35812.1 HU family DNA-binding protein [Shewanella psychromarinicola]MCL1083678.1 HU family DNA-binding protein [Shewanella psychromarinicola]PKG77116.1 HU family DNA-binding protein [Shewanella sp. Actino-trap-3]RPA22846.1 HU family DNA-binding protein [Shewanella psychromarinicola]|tara:strand:- start:439 stop:714 length:276 start_codon:yes stop_codon:yes gene_type:complete
MNKKQLIQSMAIQLAIPQNQVKPQLEQILAVIHQGLTEGEKIYIPQFGTFELRFYLPKLGRNPQTGETIDIDGFNQPSFKASPALKTLINT